MRRGERLQMIPWEFISFLISENLQRGTSFNEYSSPQDLRRWDLKKKKKSNHKTQIQGTPSFVIFIDHGTSSHIANNACGSSLRVHCARSCSTGWNILI